MKVPSDPTSHKAIFFGIKMHCGVVPGVVAAVPLRFPLISSTESRRGSDRLTPRLPNRGAPRPNLPRLLRPAPGFDRDTLIYDEIYDELQRSARGPRRSTAAFILATGSRDQLGRGLIRCGVRKPPASASGVAERKDCGASFAVVRLSPFSR
jgi:hypothetical protein